MQGSKGDIDVKNRLLDSIGEGEGGEGGGREVQDVGDTRTPMAYSY